MGSKNAPDPKRRNTSSMSSAEDTRERKADMKETSNRGSVERITEPAKSNEVGA